MHVSRGAVASEDEQITRASPWRLERSAAVPPRKIRGHDRG